MAALRLEPRESKVAELEAADPDRVQLLVVTRADRLSRLAAADAPSVVLFKEVQMLLEAATALARIRDRRT